MLFTFMWFIWFGLSEQTSFVSWLVYSFWTGGHIHLPHPPFVSLFLFFWRVFPFWLCQSLNGLQWPQPVYELGLGSGGWRTCLACVLTHTVRTSSFLPVSLRRAERRIEWKRTKKRCRPHSPTISSVDDMLKYHLSFHITH